MAHAAFPKKKLVRQIQINGEARVVQQTWRDHGGGYLLTSTLMKKGTQKILTAGQLQKKVADGEELLVVAREHLDFIRQRAEKCGKKKTTAVTSSPPAARTRTSADTAISDPLAAAMQGGTRSAAPPRMSRKEEVSLRVVKFCHAFF